MFTSVDITSPTKVTPYNYFFYYLNPIIKLRLALLLKIGRKTTLFFV